MIHFGYGAGLKYIFDFGKSQITPASDSIIQHFVEKHENKEAAFVEIEAHTDSIGSVRSNLLLSNRRAEAVKERLKTLGFNPAHIKEDRLGESRPQATNSTDVGRQLNRRASILVVAPRKMTWLEGRVTDVETGEGIPAEIIIRFKDHRDSARTDETGLFRLPVPDQTVIGIDVFAQDYYFATQMLKTNGVKPIPLELKLPKIKVGQVIALENFYFVGNEAILLPRSEPELFKLLRMMQVNRNVRIEIAGHINHPNRPRVDMESWNYDLSLRRSRMVHDYLLEHGVDPARIGFVAYGNWFMKFPHAISEREQELNRRVEIRVMDNGESYLDMDPMRPDSLLLLERWEGKWKDSL